MKYLLGIAIFSAAVLAAEKSPIASPDYHAFMAYKWLQKQPGKEYIRFLSYYNYQDLKSLEDRTKSMRFWINQLHFESGRSFAEEVPGSDRLLFAFDLREFGWSKAAFSAVARREPYFREPGIDSATAILLRKMISVEQDPKSLHVEAIVRADWFFRETFESDRSPSYYDLLYAKQRFGVKTVTTSEKTELFRDAYGVLHERKVPGETKTTAGFVQFPKNEADFEKIFAVDKFHDHLKEFKIDTRHGAVVDGIEKGVSIVARQNRLIERIISSMGSYYKTFDVKETSGKRDFAETLNKDFEFDAGEILADLPGGGMAALLVDSKGNIVETADNRFAMDSADMKFDSRVRTPGSCFICHEQKYIKPTNLVAQMLKAGVDIKFKKKEDSVAAKGFFLDWEDKLEDEQARFSKFIIRTSGFKPGENATKLKAWRDEYDKPVDLATAVRESGVDETSFKLVASKSTKARILMLLKGMPMPRRTWEVDSYREIQLLINASKK